MGSGASLSSLPETISKSECMVLVGSSFSEEMWAAHSRDGVMTRSSLLQLYTSRTDGITDGLDMMSEREDCRDEIDTAGMARHHSPPPPRASTSLQPQTHSAGVNSDNDALPIPPPDDAVVHLTSPDGSSSYEGTCYEGKPHGEGKFTFKSGAFYEGGYCMGKKHGQGLYKYGSGAVYCGEWKNDKKHGKGVYRLPTGDEYRGGWEDNLKSGYGRYSYESVDGGVYTGEWKHDKKHGKGTYAYSNGDVYVGYWVMGKKSGSGRYTYSSGEVYDGDWNANLMHGHGKFWSADGKVAYEGAYQFGSIFKFSSVTDPNGSASSSDGV